MTVLLFDYNKRPFETVGHVTTCQMRNMLPELHVCDFFEIEKVFFSNIRPNVSFQNLNIGEIKCFIKTTTCNQRAFTLTLLKYTGVVHGV